MKVKELIEFLESYDPETDVVVGGSPIHFIEQLPGYYDGSYQRLIQDISKSPYYNVQGMEFTRSGSKVQIHTMTIDDIVWNAENEDELNSLIFKMDESLSQPQKDKFSADVELSKQSLIKYLKESKG